MEIAKIFIIILGMGYFPLILRLAEKEAKYLSETSSFKIALKEKDKEIEKLKKEINKIKNFDVDVEI